MNKFPSASNAWTAYLPAVSSTSTSNHPASSSNSSSDMQSSADFWSSIGKSYQIAFDSLPAQHRAIQWLIETLAPKSKILDLGCGTGKPVCTCLSAAGHDVLGVDISPEMLRVAREQVPSGRFVEGDTRTWGPPGDDDGTFDAIIVILSLICDVSQSDIREFFSRAAGWLNPGGCLVYGTVPVAGERVKIKWLGKEAVCSGLSEEENVACIEGAGFEVVERVVEKFMPKGEESGICGEEDVWEEEHLFVWGRKR